MSDHPGLGILTPNVQNHQTQGKLTGVQPSGHTGPHAQKGPTPGFMLCCGHLEILHKF